MASRYGLVAVSLGAFLALAVSGAHASSLERFSDFISQTLTARGEFEQQIFDQNRKLLQESRGVLAFSRPGKFRWNYVKPYAQLVVGDGSRVWIYDEDLKQVTVKKLDQALGSTPAALLAGMGFGSSGLEVMELVDSFGQTTVLKFASLERNPKLDPGLFRFSPPKGADVIGDVK